MAIQKDRKANASPATFRGAKEITLHWLYGCVDTTLRTFLELGCTVGPKTDIIVLEHDDTAKKLLEIQLQVYQIQRVLLQVRFCAVWIWHSSTAGNTWCDLPLSTTDGEPGTS